MNAFTFWFSAAILYLCLFECFFTVFARKSENSRIAKAYTYDFDNPVYIAHSSSLSFEGRFHREDDLAAIQSPEVSLISKKFKLAMIFSKKQNKKAHFCLSLTLASPSVAFSKNLIEFDFGDDAVSFWSFKLNINPQYHIDLTLNGAENNIAHSMLILDSVPADKKGAVENALPSCLFDAIELKATHYIWMRKIKYASKDINMNEIVAFDEEANLRKSILDISSDDQQPETAEAAEEIDLKASNEADPDGVLFEYIRFVQKSSTKSEKSAENNEPAAADAAVAAQQAAPIEEPAKREFL